MMVMARRKRLLPIEPSGIQLSMYFAMQQVERASKWQEKASQELAHSQPTP